MNSAGKYGFTADEVISAINKMGETVQKFNKLYSISMEDKNEEINTWHQFYTWLHDHNYYIVEKSYIFREGKLITDFDPVEDDDSGELEETIERIKEKDFFIWGSPKGKVSRLSYLFEYNRAIGSPSKVVVFGIDEMDAEEKLKEEFNLKSTSDSITLIEEISIID